MAVTSYFRRIVSCLPLAGAFFALSLQAGTVHVDLSTYTDAWFVTLGGILNGVPGPVNGAAIHQADGQNGPNGISRTVSFSDSVGQVSGSGNPGTGTAIGTYLSGASPQSFTGIWYLDAAFDLPADATNITLTLSRLHVDDRAQVFLNQMPDPGVTDATLDPATALVTQYRGSSFNGTGVFGHEVVTKNCSIASNAYNPPDTSTPCIDDQSGVQYNPLLDGSLSVTGGFHIGTQNHLTVFINNVSCGADDQSCANAGSIQLYPNSPNGDGTWLQLNATLTYDSASAVPEPGMYWIMGSGLVGLIGWRRKRR